MKHFLTNIINTYKPSVKICFQLPNNTEWFFDNPKSETTVQIKIIKWRALFKFITEPFDIAFGECYFKKYIIVSDLRKLLNFENDTNILPKSDRSIKATFKTTIEKITHKVRSNSKWMAKRNIKEHYCIGNDLYKLFLDPTMNYSSALYLSDKDDLHQAQTNKIARIMEKTKNAKSILEIGCGWGSIMNACANAGKTYKGISLSKEQLKVCESFENNDCKAFYQDYRDEKGQYDAIISIEMIEAVGFKYLDSYFKILKSSLKPQGNIILQAILVPDSNYDRYTNTSDFIRKHIFPGGHLLSDQHIRELCEKNNLKIIESYEMTQSYAKTLTAWDDSFISNKEKVLNLGYSEIFYLKWRVYFNYCILLFRSEKAMVKQYEIVHK